MALLRPGRRCRARLRAHELPPARAARAALWKRPSAPKYDVLAGLRQGRADPGAVAAAAARALLRDRHAERPPGCIDTGITGEIDWQQGDWLARISKRPKDKVLLTGKPLVVDHPSTSRAAIAAPATARRRFETVDAIVRDPAHSYVATIGGDIHNYQHYTPTPTATRQAHYIVSGGGGAFMSATHPNPASAEVEPDKDLPLEACGLEFEKVEHYPSRVESLRSTRSCSCRGCGASCGASSPSCSAWRSRARSSSR